MKFSLSVFLVSLLTIPALAQTDPPPPVIAAITPSSGSVSGVTRVVIAGERLGLPQGFACILPCPAKVTFDGVLAELNEEKDTALLVLTPPHTAGAVDVTVTTGDNRRVTAKSAFTYVSEIEAQYERLLLPVYLDGEVPGPGGARWATLLWLRNNSGEPLSLAPWPCIAEACPAVFPLTRTLLPGESLQNLAPFFRPPTANPSRVLYVSKPGADRLSRHLRLFNIAGDALDAGTELPVVRDNDLLTSTAQFHEVPLNDRFRMMLRIYDLGRSDSRFRVRIYEQAAGTSTAPPIREVEIITTLDETGEFKTKAAYAAYSDFNSLLESPLPRPPSLRVEVEPLTQGSRFWAFVSITNNATQRVTLVTPQ